MEPGIIAGLNIQQTSRIAHNVPQQAEQLREQQNSAVQAAAEATQAVPTANENLSLSAIQPVAIPIPAQIEINADSIEVEAADQAELAEENASEENGDALNSQATDELTPAFENIASQIGRVEGQDELAFARLLANNAFGPNTDAGTSGQLSGGNQEAPSIPVLDSIDIVV